MPGIVGLITKAPREWAKRQLWRMVEAIRHEPFYRTGTWIDESLGVYVGWVQHDSDPSAEMPLQNESGDVTLVFSGQEYPEPGTADRLRARGHHLQPDGLSYLVHLYEELPSFPADLTGRFHGLVVDRRRGTARLFNDRYGMGRLYYHQSTEAFYFAAEAKAILGVRPELRRLDPRGLGEWVSCGCVLEDRSLFKDIHLLPGASNWVFEHGALTSKAQYFAPREWEEQPLLNPEAYYEHIREVFSGILTRYFQGPAPIAMSLTGGLDTRMIMAWLKCPPGSLPCYTFGGMFHDCKDVVIARKIARLCGQPHQVIRVDEKFLSRFPDYAERTVFLTDGSAAVSCSADLYVNQIARQIAPVRMTGNYGGEVLRRVRAFKPMETLRCMYQPEMWTHIDEAKRTYNQLLDFHPLSFAVFKAPWHHYGLLALEQSQLSLRSPYLDNEFVRTVFRAPESATRTNDVCLRLIADANVALAGIPTDRGVGGNATRLSAAVRHSLLELQFKAEYAYDYGMPQWAAPIDRLLSPVHPERLFLGRHKFYHYRIWYRDALSSYLKDMLLDTTALSRPHVERKSVEAIVTNHIRGVRNHTLEIHKLLTLELIHRVLLDAPAISAAPHDSDPQYART